MNRKISSVLDAIRARMDEASPVCTNCGCDMSEAEAMEYGDGKMLCEACWAEMKGEAKAEFRCLECGKGFSKPVDECPKCGGSDIDIAESVDSDDTFVFYEWIGSAFVEKKEQGPVLATVPSKSDPEKSYEIRMGNDGNMYCSCPAWKYQKKSPKDRTCKHIDALNKAMKSQAKLNPKEESIELDDCYIVLEGELGDTALALDEAKKGKKPKLGSGKRFKALAKKLSGREDIENPEALAAWIGRKKYGAKFSKMAAAGRRRAKK